MSVLLFIDKIVINNEKKLHVEKTLELQKSLSSLARDLTVFLTNGNLSDTASIEQHKDIKLWDLLKDKKLSMFSPLIDKWYESNTLWNFIDTFKQDCWNMFEDNDFKKRYTQQLTIGSACLEWVPEKIIDKVYGANVPIDKEMQKIFKHNHLTFMDLTGREVVFWKKERELFLYSMLFLHDWENKNIDQANESWYYKVNEWFIEIKKYGVKSYEQAFNCGFQIYNEFFWHNKDNADIFHHPINSVDDIYALYDNTITLHYNWKNIDSHTLAWILNITRALLHIQAHKHLDYIRWEIHDPASFIKYKKGIHWKEVYGSQIDEVRDWEIASLWREELSTLDLTDTKGNNIKERSPSFYSANTKSWHLQSIIFNDVETSFTWRSKWLTSWIMKLINDPKYKKWKDVTDSLWNSFYVKNKEDWLKIWLWLIEKLPEVIVDGARLDIKWTGCWVVLLKKISNNNKILDKKIIYENLKEYNISQTKIDLLLRNKFFLKNLDEKLYHTDTLKNNKTAEWYEEFKIVTTNGTEYQISEKSDDMVMSYNEFWLWNHGIYNIKKLMELLLRPDNHTMTLWHDTIENIITNALDEEEIYLQQKAYKMWILNNENSDVFNPRNAILNQLLYDDMLHNEFVDSNIIAQIKNKRSDFFIWDKETSREGVKEFIYNMINNEYVWYLTQKNTYNVSKPLWNQRSILSQLLWYKVYLQNKRLL